MRCCGMSADGRHVLAAAENGFLFRFEYTAAGAAAGRVGAEGGEGLKEGSDMRLVPDRPGFDDESQRS